MLGFQQGTRNGHCLKELMVISFLPSSFLPSILPSLNILKFNTKISYFHFQLDLFKSTVPQSYHRSNENYFHLLWFEWIPIFQYCITEKKEEMNWMWELIFDCNFHPWQPILMCLSKQSHYFYRWIYHMYIVEIWTYKNYSNRAPI